MKKKALIIITVSLITVSAILGLLYWGLQPVQEEQVSLKKLNKALDDRYCIPSELPFEGDVECYIVYVRGHMGVVLTRFEINPKRSTGYSIKLKDGMRGIYIETGDSIGIGEEAEKSLVTEHCNGQKIEYLFSETETEKKLTVLFEINGRTYYLIADYNKDVDNDVLKSDITFILDRMIKR